MSVKKPVELDLWEVNQGKRLIKRLHKCGVRPGQEFDFLLHAIKTSEATIAVDQAKGQGSTPEAATAAAMAAMDRVKTVERTGHVGCDLFRLMVENGASPGRVKTNLDKVLFAAGVTDSNPVQVVRTDVESPDYTADRFPESPRDNY